MLALFCQWLRITSLYNGAALYAIDVWGALRSNDHGAGCLHVATAWLIPLPAADQCHSCCD